jgi:pSer/pThr/pTyr-binding forkhead associated (FHA) protein
MIKCPFCENTYPENTLFCEECGSYLTANDDQATDSLGEENTDRAEQGQPSSMAFATLVLTIEDGGCIELPLSKEVVLGRLDASRAVFPDVDLMSEDGIEKGVSRRHARISRQGQQVFIEDLRSLNGTFLNGHHLVPEMPYPLKDGDQVQVGKLVLVVNLK